MNLVYLCAYGINEKRRKMKMEGLLTGYTKKREECLDSFEKPIIVKTDG